MVLRWRLLHTRHMVSISHPLPHIIWSTQWASKPGPDLWAPEGRYLPPTQHQKQRLAGGQNEWGCETIIPIVPNWLEHTQRPGEAKQLSQATWWLSWDSNLGTCSEASPSMSPLCGLPTKCKKIKSAEWFQGLSLGTQAPSGPPWRPLSICFQCAFF